MLFVSLIGDFDSNILPLFYHHAEEIRLHVMLSDRRRSDVKHAENLTRGMKRYCSHHDIDVAMHEMAFDEDSIDAIRDVYESVAELRQSGEPLYFNLSDGLASTVAVLQPLIMRDNGVLLAYDRFENSCNYINLDGMDRYTVSPMSIDEHLLLKNIDYNFIDETFEMQSRKAAVFALMNDTAEYLRFRAAYSRNDVPADLEHLHRHAKSMSAQTGRNFFNGQIFEEYCYWLVNDLGFDDVRLGTKVTHLPHTANDYENEFDLLMIKNNHLHIMECKLRTHINGEHFIYKYDSLKGLLDADGKTMIVSAGGSNVKEKANGKKEYQFNEGNLKRARQARIAVYQQERLDPEAFVRQVKQFFLGS